MNGVRHFLLALQFFTRVPVTGSLAAWVGFSPQMLRASAAHLPGIGWLVGGVAALVFVAVGVGLQSVAGAFAAAVLSTVATVMLTGAFHEDGLADVADGLGGSAHRDRALEIMKDSRIGAYGAVGLVLMLGLKAAALVSLPLVAAVPALLLAHTASRAAAVVLIRALPYAGDVEHAKAKPMAQRVEISGVIAAAGWVVFVAAALAWHAPHQATAVLASLSLAIVGTAWCAGWLHRRLGGYTGDALGATQQITELLALLGWLGLTHIA
jgi:adenosylcobinamide-GDP ribazoletransferase